MNDNTQCKIIGWVILVICLGLLAGIAASGCQTVRGAAHDLGCVTDYVQEQIPPTDSR